MIPPDPHCLLSCGAELGIIKERAREAGEFYSLRPTRDREMDWRLLCGGGSDGVCLCYCPITLEKETLWANLVQHSRLSARMSSRRWSLVKSILTRLLLYTLFILILFAINTYENFCRLQKASDASQKDTSVEVLRKDAAACYHGYAMGNFFFLVAALFRQGEHFITSDLGIICVNFLPQWIILSNSFILNNFKIKFTS